MIFRSDCHSEGVARGISTGSLASLGMTFPVSFRERSSRNLAEILRLTASGGHAKPASEEGFGREIESQLRTPAPRKEFRAPQGSQKRGVISSLYQGFGRPALGIKPASSKAEIGVETKVLGTEVVEMKYMVLTAFLMLVGSASVHAEDVCGQLGVQDNEYSKNTNDQERAENAADRYNVEKKDD